MEFTPASHPPTELELLALLKRIWAVEGSALEQDHLIAQFEAATQHPQGSDVLFYPFDYGSRHSPERVVALIRVWRQHQGLPPLTVQAPNPADEGVSQKPSHREVALNNAQVLARAAQRVAEAGQRGPASAQVRDLAAHLDASEQACDDAQHYLEGLILAVEPLISAPTPPEQEVEQAPLLDDSITQVEIARQHAWRLYVAVGIASSRMSMAQSRARFSVKASGGAAAQADGHFLDILDSNHRARWVAMRAYAQSLQARAQTYRLQAENRITLLQAIAATGPLETPAVYSVPLKQVVESPCVLTPSTETIRLFDEVAHSLRNALAAAAARISSGAWQGDGYANLLLCSAKLGHGERYGFCAPLALFAPQISGDWQALGHARGNIELPWRVGTAVQVESDGSEFKQVFLASVRSPAAGVRVRFALWDAQAKAYAFNTDDPVPVTLLFTPGNVESAGTQSLASKYPGVTSVPAEPVHHRFAFGYAPEFDDYVVSFPDAAQMPPLYVSFKDKRNYPGVVQGQGHTYSSSWRGEIESFLGALVPASIASALVGKVFRHFQAFRQAFWLAVAADATLVGEFDSANQGRMGQGLPPDLGKGEVQLRHRLAVDGGTQVYHLDYMVVAG